MRVGILGSGTVGRTIGAKLVELGHEVVIGTRNPSSTLAHGEPDVQGNPPFGEWRQSNPRVSLGTFEQAAAHGEIVFNATAGMNSLEALAMAGRGNLSGKVLIDVANPLDFSQGAPPTLAICNTDSLAEQIQRALPESRVVKIFNTMNAQLMVNPSLLPGDHDVFISGNDPEAKATVTDMLKSWFGWKSVIDLGDITTARGTEMFLPLWLRLFGALQTPMFNIKIVRQD